MDCQHEGPGYPPCRSCMTLEEFKNKYGTDTAGLIIDHLAIRLAKFTDLSEHEQKMVAVLKADLKALLK